MMSGVVKYVVVGSISVLVAARAAFGSIGIVSLFDLTMIFLGGAGMGAAVAGLLYRLGRIHRRRRQSEAAQGESSARGYDGMADPVSR